MKLRKPRRWIQHFKVDLRADRHHRLAIRTLGFEEYCKIGLINVSDDALEELFHEEGVVWGLVRPPQLPPIPPYGDHW
jgi:hypothetical protein